MIVLLTGPHAAGKSTLGFALSAELGLPFHDELGKRMGADLRLRAASVGAADPQPHFDEAVFSAELERDAEFRAAHGDAPRIVEIWHPGNLAYARARSGGTARRWWPRLRDATRSERVIHVRVVAGEAILMARRNERGTTAFFAEVARDADRIARRCGIGGSLAVSTDAVSAASIARDLVVYLAPALGRRPNAPAPGVYGGRR